MRTFAKSRIRYSKSQRMGIFAFLIVLIGLQFFIFFQSRNEPVYEVAEVPEEVLHLDRQLANAKTSTNYSAYSLGKFDPNELSAEEWQNLGFSEKQVNTILKYKYSLGGYFSNKEQIKNSFVISEKKFAEIEPYIVFGDLKQFQNSKNSYVSFSKETKPKIRYEKFNPNDYTQADWQRIGFSEKQATTILKYKKSKGGKFTSLEQIAACFVISDEKFAEMKPYMVLPIVKSKSKGEIKLLEEEVEISEPKALKIEKFNPNQLTVEDWLKLGFTEKQANTILNYKKSLGGKFKDAEAFGKCYAVSAEKFAELEPYMVFD